MSVIQAQCPHCATRLRLRDGSFLGRVIPCPDCRQPLLVTRNALDVIECVPARDGDVGTADAKSPEPTSAPASKVASTTTSTPTVAESAHTAPPSRLTPGRIGWGVAIVALVVGAVVMNWLPDSDREPQGDGTAQVDPVPGGASDADAGPSVTPEDLPGDDHPVAVQMQTLGEWIGDYRTRHGVFPEEQPLTLSLEADARLGWEAALLAELQPEGPQPLWDRPYDDPLNSRFVRRRMPALLNPEVAAAAADGFPATHFAGVSGVGENAHLLPISDPRAGIFGVGRATRSDDVRDGLSNTLLVIGIAKSPAPWAAGGPSTMRSFTREPYINGPDGFGTGQEQGMFVLLADGSVKFFAFETSSVVLRRMAAMADGLPLDPQVPGEPGDAAASTPADDPVVAVDPVEPGDDPAPGIELPPGSDEPILPELAADPRVVPKPEYDVEVALSQPIARFSQVRPAKFIDLIRQVEEMAAVPISTREIAASEIAGRLDREVSLELEETTVGGLLEALVQTVDLRIETGREFGIRLVPPGPPGS
jgi:hypothetical protein